MVMVGGLWRMLKVNNEAETKYGITELECLAVWLMTSTNLTGKLHRWALTLQEYDFDVEYRPGNTNVVADALSRAPLVYASGGWPKAKEKKKGPEVECCVYYGYGWWSCGE
ncbi:LOW QUALITY PROTEIN: Gag-pol Polyprotein [Phytophthora megakarya]|uniref:Gag-pol Polyprotein n=1 Tax=Phytophthora megakarya TaxID=4795 RepID=A0A225UIL7_9STRA|nr:LOW QUALITY PROTEIN: Gag-pol Polyprotein [Phytophthora megakarya]